MRTHYSSSGRRAQLNVESLETRDVPTGNVTAAISGGILNLTGDDFDNVVSIEITGANVIVTPDASTSINGGVAGVAANVATVPTGLKASFFNGDDSLSIKNNVDFILTGGAAVDLGHGANALAFATSTKVELGSLTVKAGDGDEVVTVSAGAGLGKITGKATFDYGDGAASTTLNEMNISGSKGLSVKSTGTNSSIVTNTLNATNVQIPKGVSLTGIGGVASTFTGSTIGKLSESGVAATTVLNTTTVNGNVKLKGVYAAQLNATTVTINGNVDLSTAGILSVASSSWNGTNSVTGNISQSGLFQVVMQVNGLATDTFTVGGNISLKGPDSYTTQLATNNVAFTAKNVSVSGGITAFVAGGKSVTINNLTMKGTVYSQTVFSTTSPSEVKGNISVTGGWLTDQFVTNSFFKAAKNVTLKLGDNANTVQIGDGTAGATIQGNLSIDTGSGDDTISLSNVTVSGKTKIKTGGGYDSLHVNSASVFTGTFTADLGTGDDLISIAQTAGAAAPVKFNAKATIKAGDGNDTLQLGVAGGDAGQVANFVAGSIIDGGTGFNAFDTDIDNSTGILATDITGWTDI